MVISNSRIPKTSIKTDENAWLYSEVCRVENGKWLLDSLDSEWDITSDVLTNDIQKVYN